MPAISTRFSCKLLTPPLPLTAAVYGKRNVSILVQLGRNLLRVRYIVIGSLVGGGITVSQTVQSWKDKLPDFDWLTDHWPNSDSMNKYIEYTKDIPAVIQQRGRHFNERLRSNGKMALSYVGDWLSSFKPDVLTSFSKGLGPVPCNVISSHYLLGMALYSGMPEWEELESSYSLPIAEEFNKPTVNPVVNEANSLDVQLKFQRQMEKLEKENAELRHLLTLNNKTTDIHRRSKQSLIEMYSEVLDILADYDASYKTQDCLPRVIVVGDQSSGKTSVLEMVAQARIFPRGSGEMMTRAPVKVTLSEGPYHIAKFKDSEREFDLTKESDVDYISTYKTLSYRCRFFQLAELRYEIELRMRNSVTDGKTVSKEVIALAVQGPSLPRMVLIDLPGVISTVTSEMAVGTKNDILDICRCHMENPNAIILCIQDGSVDAERSNVTDLVASLDPQGKRTILVLTKVDLAEENLINPDRVKKILDGKLFPMKAIGYFAVVAGKGNQGDSIEAIKEYEEEFFANSKLFRALESSQLTTRNMSLAVSDRFWTMVKESVEQQADSFKAKRFNLETEWRNTFPKKRELDRDELFEKARNELLDEINALEEIASKDWETALREKIWKRMSSHVFDKLYFPAAVEESIGAFTTSIDIKLKRWVDNALPAICVEAAWDALREKLTDIVAQDASKMEHVSLFEPLKNAIIEQAFSAHAWDPKACYYLRVIQSNAIEDRNVPDRVSWEMATQFMETTVKEQLINAEHTFREMVGPGWSEKWLLWASAKESQNRKPFLEPEEVALACRNIEVKGGKASPEELRDVWHHLYHRNFLHTALSSARECKNLFVHYQNGFLEAADCASVVVFWRIHRMLNATVNALRQQIVNKEARRLEAEIKRIIVEWSQNADVKKKFIVGRQVELAEQLSTFV
ncbi:dynamin 120 kDa protein, mitochondrial like [Trichuris trichiura]|uniref:Dynamin-like GTPase OPA1, mitochondrial n=1 Tax=Trichuris trichiura TaxID=36087 RepID=A0A077ZK72_TRITR|nr:dynamin 120 kDa protein, mitochondrial like [Trichuris trichiura]